MPIQRLIKEASFAPEQVAVLVGVFEATCEELGLKDRDDPLREMVAKTVVHLAAVHGFHAAELQTRVLFVLKANE